MKKNQPKNDAHMWKPPLNYGLNNSEKNIPDYYLVGKCHEGKIFQIDYFSTIVDSVKNLRELTKSQITYLSENPKKQLDIIRLYDVVLKKVISDL
jgi:hypothetical protein